MIEVPDFSIYCSYFGWNCKIEITLLTQDLNYIHFVLLIMFGFLNKDGDDISQNTIVKFLCFDVIMTSQVMKGS